ncbi:MAG: glycosyl transferase [Desulfobacteraceae bacterium]|nr:MAG: glycosyl transferase [Desulfobacteraceae bacterium]
MISYLMMKFGLAFGLSAILTPLIRSIAIKKSWVAAPTQDRWHQHPTPSMGGIAIISAIILPLIFMADFGSVIEQVMKKNGFGDTPSLSAVLIMGSIFLFGLGLFDDLHNIKPHNKLIGQILAASLVVFLGFRLHWFTSMTLDTMATLFWIVGLTNAFNLIDNMDGLCAGVGFVAAICLTVLFYPLALEPFLIALVLAGAMGAFLIYNFNPAKIFMGDCGSLVIGFSISVLSLSYSEIPSTQTLARITVPILLLLVPILDTTLVTVIRVLSGRKASIGGRDHTSHRLVLMGFSEKKAVLMLCGIGAVAGFAAVFVSRTDTWTSPAVIIPVLIAITLMGIYLSQLRVYPEKEFSILRNRSFTPILMELTYKRQMLLVVFDSILIAFSYYMAYRLRFEGDAFVQYFKLFLRSLPAVIACKMLVFFGMGIYRGIWGYISANDVSLHLKASIIGTLVSMLALTVIYGFGEFSKGIFVLDWLFTTGLLLGVRGSFRLFIETQKRKTLSGEKVVIYGAGRAGELLLREILNNKNLKVVPIGFVDDDELKKGRNIQGFPIIGTFEEFKQNYQQHQIKGMLISFNNLNGHSHLVLDAAKNFCTRSGLFLKRFQIELQDVDLSNSEIAFGIENHIPQ